MAVVSFKPFRISSCNSSHRQRVAGASLRITQAAQYRQYPGTTALRLFHPGTRPWPAIGPALSRTYFTNCFNERTSQSGTSSYLAFLLPLHAVSCFLSTLLFYALFAANRSTPPYSTSNKREIKEKESNARPLSLFRGNHNRPDPNHHSWNRGDV